MGLDADNPSAEPDDGKTRITTIVPQRIPAPAPLAEPGELSVTDLVAQVRKVQEVMDAVMKRDFHYGVIPGCGDKPTLFKPGAEKLALVFRLCPSFDVTETDLAGGHRHFRVVCVLTHITTGAKIAEGVGYGSTMESKYRWRQGQRKCPKCGKPAIIKGKKEYGSGWLCWPKKDGCGAKWADGAQEIEGQSTERVENPDIADTYNTVLKMAKKRAQIDATLTATGASDIFAQDLEDLAEAAADHAPKPPAETKPVETLPKPDAVSREQQARDFEDAFDSGAHTGPARQKTPPVPDEHKAQFALYLDALGKARSKSDVEDVFVEAEAKGFPKDLRARLHRHAGVLAAERKRLEELDAKGAGGRK